MPFTPEFTRLRRRINGQYSDKAKGDTIAFKKAFDLKLSIFEETKPKWKRIP